jgi:inner membrane protein
MCGVNKIYIVRQVNKALVAQNIAVYDRMITPTPLNNLLWYIVIREQGTDDLYTGYASVQDKDPPVFKKVPRRDSLLVPFRATKTAQDLVRFSKGFYCMQKRDGMIVFNDMRFGQESGWLGSDDYVFNFSLGEEKAGMLRVQKGRFRNFRKESLLELWDRILGE